MYLRRRVCEVSTTIVIIVMGMVLYWNTNSFFPSLLPGYPGDAFFPRLTLGFLFVCSVVFLLRHVHQRFREKHGAARPVDDTVEFPLLRFLGVIAIVWLYAYLLPLIGFELSTMAYVLVVVTPRLKGKRLQMAVKGAVIALLTTLLCYFAFVMALNVSLPLKVLPRIVL